MADMLLQAILSNLLVSTVLAVIAWSVHRRLQLASISNLLWIVVLIKMVTPPLFSLPLLEVNPVSVVDVGFERELASAEFSASDALLSNQEFGLVPSETGSVASVGETVSPGNQVVWLAGLGILWMSVTVILALWSLARVLRFHFVLQRSVRPVPQATTQLAYRVAEKMDLAQLPDIGLSQANVAPFVWWLGGSPKIVLSESVVEQASPLDLRMVLAHEMAHIKRWDHYVRWLEWLAVVCLWWNPILWWARRELRVTEEIACDELVVASLGTERRFEYASSLLNMVELMTAPAIRPPAVASAIDSGGILEKRLTMIVNKKKRSAPVWLRAVIATLALALFPLGVVYGQDLNGVKKRLQRAVEAKEITSEQARVMLKALVDSALADSAKPDAGASDSVGANKSVGWDLSRLEVEQAQHKREFMESHLHRPPWRITVERHEHGEGHSEMVHPEEYLKDFVTDIEAGLKAGKLSPEDAERRLAEVRRDMALKQAERLLFEQTKQADYKRARGALEAALEKGGQTEDDARRELEEIHKVLSMERDIERREMVQREHEMAADKHRLMQVAQEIEAAVTAGKISEDDAKAKLTELHRSMDSGHEREAAEQAKHLRDLGRHHAQMMEHRRQIEKAVHEGDLSKEDAIEKLKEIRQAIVEQQVEVRAKQAELQAKQAELQAKQAGRVLRDKDLREHYLQDVERELDLAVEAGKLSKEEAVKKLLEIREKSHHEHNHDEDGNHGHEH